MIRTIKKDIAKEINEGRYNEIFDKHTAIYCESQCRRIAFSCNTYGCTGLVFVSYNGEVYATVSKTIIEKYF